MSASGTEKRGKRVSIDSKNVFDIQPIVYSFKVPPDTNFSGSVVTAPRPPQWLYHDHVMGVIWMIFHKEKNYVGISQLQWCLRFLLDLKNSQGEYTADVEICIQAIQDNLIEQYAKLGPALEKTMQEKSKKKARDQNFANESDLEDSESKRLTNLTDSTNDNEEEEEEDKNLSIPQIQGIKGTSTPQEEETETWKHEKKQIIKKSEKNCAAKCAAVNANKKKEEMLSFTYQEMMSKGPEPCKEPYLIDDSYSDKKSIEQIETELVNLESLNSSDIANFLNTSRQEYVERINKEMETLRFLERLLENLNTSGLSSRNIEDLKKSLETLQTQNVTKETEEINKLNK